MKRWYLAPFAVLYGLATGIRNFLYDAGVLKSTRFGTPVICVGNITVGGSGKSPMVMYLAELLSGYCRTGVLSRGYGRITKGYGITNYESTYKTVGDEAMQLFERFKNRFVIGVSEKRVPGAKNHRGYGLGCADPGRCNAAPRPAAWLHHYDDGFQRSLFQ